MVIKEKKAYIYTRVFITEHDILQHGLSIYHVERMIEETRELFGDGEHILYVNGAYRDDTPIGQLMYDFSCTQPEDMKFPLLANRARFLKETEEGREIMCKAFEEVRAEGAKDGAKQKSVELIRNLMKTMNLSLEKAMDALMIPENERESIVNIITQESL